MTFPARRISERTYLCFVWACGCGGGVGGEVGRCVCDMCIHTHFT